MPADNLKDILKEYNRIYKENDTLYARAAHKMGLSECVSWILYVLTISEQPFTQSELCEEIYMPKQTINSALKKLEHDGYLKLQFAENNKKSKQIVLTASGEALASATAGRIITAEQNAFAHFSAEDRQNFLRLYRQYVDQLRREIEKQL